MPTWLQIVLAVAAFIGPPLAAYYGAQKGTAVAIAVAETKIAALWEEVRLLREAKHAHAQRITEHEADLHILKRKAGIA